MIGAEIWGPANMQRLPPLISSQSNESDFNSNMLAPFDQHPSLFYSGDDAVFHSASLRGTQSCRTYRKRAREKKNEILENLKSFLKSDI